MTDNMNWKEYNAEEIFFTKRSCHLASAPQNLLSQEMPAATSLTTFSVTHQPAGWLLLYSVEMEPKENHPKEMGEAKLVYYFCSLPPAFLQPFCVSDAG